MLKSKRVFLRTISLACALVLLVWWVMTIRARVMAAAGSAAQRTTTTSQSASSGDRLITQYAQRMMQEGRQTFRYETFGSEAFWGDALQLHKAIAGAKNGGVGSG